MAPLSVDVVTRLATAIGQGKRSLSPEETGQAARDHIDSLRRYGLDVVFSTWIDEPDRARSSSEDAVWGDLARTVSADTLRREPWKPR